MWPPISRPAAVFRSPRNPTKGKRARGNERVSKIKVTRALMPIRHTDDGFKPSPIRTAIKCAITTTHSLGFLSHRWTAVLIIAFALEAA